MAKGSTFWRQAGLSYLQYLNICSHAVRVSLKEPSKARALARENIFYNKTVGDAKIQITSVLPK